WLWCMMPPARAGDWPGPAPRLPRGSLVVVRARDAAKRRRLAEQLKGVTRLLIADDPGLAAYIGAPGLHLPERRMREAAHWRARFPHWIIPSSAHSLRGLMGAGPRGRGVLWRVFATGSPQH